MPDPCKSGFSRDAVGHWSADALVRIGVAACRRFMARAILPAVVLIAPTAFAQAQVADPITEDTTWTGRVLVGESVTVAPDATLTIEPGTVVEFAEDAQLLVEGALDARGTDDEPITFGRVPGEPDWDHPGQWGGVVAESSRQFALVGCVIRGATNGVTLRDASAEHSVVDCDIASCSLAGVRIDGGSKARITDNRIHDCGTLWSEDSGDEPTESGGIWLQDASECQLRDNRIEACSEFGVSLNGADYNAIGGNTIRGIAGDHMKLHGFGIRGAYSSRNIISANRIEGCAYLLISMGGGCQENLIADNTLRNACDAINFTGYENERNICRNNRISGAGWSQLYITVGTRGNRYENCDITDGTGYALTHSSSVETVYEDCEFTGTGPLNVWHWGNCTLRRCKLIDPVRQYGEYDLKMTHNAQCTLVDCEGIRRDEVLFEDANDEHCRVVYKRAAVVTVVNDETGEPIHRAVVKAVSGADEVTDATGSDGKVHLELTEGVLRSSGWEELGAYTLTAQAQGFHAQTVENVTVVEGLATEIRLKAVADE